MMGWPLLPVVLARDWFDAPTGPSVHCASARSLNCESNPMDLNVSLGGLLTDELLSGSLGVKGAVLHVPISVLSDANPDMSGFAVE